MKSLPEDNIPSKIAEYVCLDLPILAICAHPGAIDIISRYKLGYSVAARNENEIVKTISAMLQKKKLMEILKPENKQIFSRSTFLEWFSNRLLSL